MFRTAAGVKIPFPDKVKEEFQVFEHSIRLNLSFEKLEPMLYDFINLADEPLFVVLQLPLSLDEEEPLRKDENDSYHQKVCYLDGQSKAQVMDILSKYSNIILNDGLSQFAIASHVTKDDFFIQKYKLIDIFSKNTEKFFELMEKYHISETTELATVWNTFSYETPGEAWRFNDAGRDIFDVYHELVKLGMYDAKIIED